MTTAKSLAFSLRIPIAAVSSLLAYAYNYRFIENPLCPMFDARKKEVYSGIFIFKAEDVDLILPEGAYKPQKVLDACPAGTYVFGSGAQIYHELIVSNDKKLNSIPLNLAAPRASSVALLGYKKFISNECDDLKTLIPEYYRKSEAELYFDKK